MKNNKEKEENEKTKEFIKKVKELANIYKLPYFIVTIGSYAYSGKITYKASDINYSKETP